MIGQGNLTSQEGEPCESHVVRVRSDGGVGAIWGCRRDGTHGPGLFPSRPTVGRTFSPVGGSNRLPSTCPPRSHRTVPLSRPPAPPGPESDMSQPAENDVAMIE